MCKQLLETNKKVTKLNRKVSKRTATIVSRARNTNNPETKGKAPRLFTTRNVQPVQPHSCLPSLGTLPTNPDSSARNPEHQPGGHASLWVRQQVVYVPGAGAALAPKAGSLRPWRQAEFQTGAAGRERRAAGGRGGGANLTLETGGCTHETKVEHPHPTCPCSPPTLPSEPP